MRLALLMTVFFVQQIGKMPLQSPCKYNGVDYCKYNSRSNE